MKRCSKCGQTKAPREFYTCPSAVGGLSWLCRPCTRQDSIERRMARHERVLANLAQDGITGRPYTRKLAWTQAEKDFVFQNYGPMKAPAIAAVIGRTAVAVRQMVRSGKRGVA